MQPSRSALTVDQSTRTLLLRAGERLFAETGIAGTSTRAILRAAGQRNESALHYHFGGREGLIEAIYAERGAEVNEERRALLAELHENGDPLSVRQLCRVAFMPPVHLARRDPDFYCFLKLVGQIAFAPNETLKAAQKRYELDSVAEVLELFKAALDLPEALALRRLELLHRMAATTLAQRARNNQSFKGRAADFYFHTTLDAMSAMLTTPPSPETLQVLERRSRKGSKRRRSRAKGGATS